MRRLSTIVLLILAVQPALGHTTGQPHTETSPVPPVVLAAGLFVFGTTLVLEYRDLLSRRLTIAGLGVGVVLSGVGAGLFLT
ncbi:hypothetical protein [Halapricum salinum]|uniref:Uncharacterized protein n=1 Tax=Halapricum salinum TaxID=1457250 RepID=A0A4D6HBJ2_9EURY|nr:hypothetical protein [Halapricum salinum]QCC51180.1 hypothetical protein DV733_07965 [Halapricum salinum]